MTKNGVENTFTITRAEGLEKTQFIGDIPLSPIYVVILIVYFMITVSLYIIMCLEIKKSNFSRQNQPIKSKRNTRLCTKQRFDLKMI